jgi:hypothetical protein
MDAIEDKDRRQTLNMKAESSGALDGQSREIHPCAPAALNMVPVQGARSAISYKGFYVSTLYSLLNGSAFSSRYCVSDW